MVVPPPVRSVDRDVRRLSSCTLPRTGGTPPCPLPTGFVQVQRNLGTDRLDEYVRHTSSSVFACLPGVHDAWDWWGHALFQG
jgi:hypothetical protein